MLVTNEWQSVAEQISRAEKLPLIVMVVGDMDSGKSTFCAFLANQIYQVGLKVAVVDADLGQSDIGLPTTIGAGFVKRPIHSLRDISCHFAYFVGSHSPSGLLLPTLTGTKLIAQKPLQSGADAVIVDTDGWVHDGHGKVLKQFMFELLRPTHVVLLQRDRELDFFERQWKDIGWVEVIKIPVPKAVDVKSREQRRQFRQQRFREWLDRCKEILLPISSLKFRNVAFGQGITLPKNNQEILSQLLGVKVTYAEKLEDSILVFVDTPPTGRLENVRNFLAGSPFIRWVTPSHYEQVIVGLLDRNDELISVGITFRLNIFEGFLSVLALPVPTSRVHTVSFGYLRLALDGTELDTIPVGSL